MVIIEDYGKLKIQKEKDPATDNIHIVIPPIEDLTNKNSPIPMYGGANYYAFGHSKTFRYMAIRIKSKDPKLSCAYTISYSSG